MYEKSNNKKVESPRKKNGKSKKTRLPNVVGHGQHSTTIQKDFQDLVVVTMGGQDEGRNLRREGGSVAVSLLPRLRAWAWGEREVGVRRLSILLGLMPFLLLV